MNYQKMLLTALLISGQMNAMHNTEFNQSRFCPLLKQIKPEASRTEYFKLMKTLQKNAMSPCECMQYLSQVKLEKSLQNVREEWDIDEYVLINIKNFINYLQAEKPQKLTIGGAPDCPKYIKRSLESSLKDTHVKAVNVEGSWNDTGVTKKIDNEKFDDEMIQTVQKELYKQEPDFEKLLQIIGNENILYLSPLFFKISKTGQRGILEHESAHLKKEHPLFEWLVRLAAIHKNQSYFYQSGKIRDSKSFDQFRKARESEADRIPAACGTKKTACMMEIMTKQLQKKNKVGRNAGYPSYEKSLEWAKKIRKLKAAEESIGHQQELKKNLHHNFNILQSFWF